MITNKLSTEEFNDILRPILRLSTIEVIKFNVYKILHFQKAKQIETDQYILNTKSTGVSSTYKGFELEIRRLPDQKNGYSGLIFQMRKRKRISDLLFNPAKKIASEIKTICSEEISKSWLTEFDPGGKAPYNVRETFFYQLGAKYPNWKEESKISPLALYVREDDKGYTIEFLFHPECYERVSDKTSLRIDWIEIFSKSPRW